MEGPEVPLEQAQEHINQHAEHAEGATRRWILGVALSSAVFAALAAVTSLLAGHHVNEALIAQIEANNEIVQASNQWAYYQAKGIKSAVLGSRLEFLKALDKPVSPEDLAKVEGYNRDQEEIKAKAAEYQHQADHLKEEGNKHLNAHVVLARAVTMFQVSIAVAAISVLVQRRLFWYVSLTFGALGIFFFAQELLQAVLRR